MRFKIQIDGAEHEIEAGADGTVSLGGETFEAKVGKPSEERRTVQLGDKTYEVHVIEDCADSGAFVLELAGERIPLTVTDVSKVAFTAARGAGTAAGGAESSGAGKGDQAAAGSLDEVKEGIWAPMPGKIVGVLAKAGDAVDEGDPVLILEAMKMENELRAPKKGTVSAVLVEKGDQAEKGQLLVAFE